MSFETYLKECPLVAILRGITPEEVPSVCDVLYENGIRLLEIPLNSPDALKSIAINAIRTRLGTGKSALIAVHDAGGEFIISPNTDAEVIRETKRLGMISMPGFFTASEAFTAIKAGADYLKLFPAILGPGYVKDLKAVVKKPIFAVGGVNAGNIPEFMKVCAGVGIGSALYKPGKTLDAIAKDAAAMVAGVKN